MKRSANKGWQRTDVVRVRSMIGITLLLVACPAAPAGPVCVCAVARLKGGWCPACKVGYLASVRITSEMLFEALDAHGHDFDPAAITCLTCQKAMTDGGYCDQCRMGFVHGQAYLSRLTYHLARGEARDPKGIACPKCRKNSQQAGWCDDCKIGMIGNVATADKKEYEDTLREFQRLLKAIQMIPRCESCAVAMFTGGTCPSCKISYKDGKPREDPKKP